MLIQKANVEVIEVIIRQTGALISSRYSRRTAASGQTEGGAGEGARGGASAGGDGKGV